MRMGGNGGNGEWEGRVRGGRNISGLKLPIDFSAKTLGMSVLCV